MIKQISKYLNLLFLVILPSVSIELFGAYLSGIMQGDHYHSVLRISEKTQKHKRWKFYDLLKQKINWKKIFYELAKAVLRGKDQNSWSIIIDASPLEQHFAEYRITKKDPVSIKDMKNVPHNQVVSLILTDGIRKIVFDYRIWVSKKVSKASDYVKQTDLALDMLKKYHTNNLTIKTVLIDSGFSSKQILKWLNKNGYIWFTRLKKNRVIYIDGIKYNLEGLNIKIDSSIIGELQNIRSKVKILRLNYQDEDVYVATNAIELNNTKIKNMFKRRWKIELFHREAKQHLGLNYIHMESYRALKNHVGFVCLAFSLLSCQQKSQRTKIGDIKRKIQDELYSTHDGIDRFMQKLVS